VADQWSLMAEGVAKAAASPLQRAEKVVARGMADLPASTAEGVAAAAAAAAAAAVAAVAEVDMVGAADVAEVDMTGDRLVEAGMEPLEEKAELLAEK